MWKSIPDGEPDRLVALADGVFAIALTLLVLDFSVPQNLDPADYDDALRELLPNFGAYALSVLVLGAFWREHRRIFGYVRQVDGQLITLSILGLGVAALLPFPTKLLAEYGREPESGGGGGGAGGGGGGGPLKRGLSPGAPARLGPPDRRPPRGP
ncbi:TMEM175 family protein, partial [Streptomyces sp. NPDC054756]